MKRFQFHVSVVTPDGGIVTDHDVLHAVRQYLRAGDLGERVSVRKVVTDHPNPEATGEGPIYGKTVGYGGELDG